ncbi:MalY/PatB family protein [Paraliobacillus sp. JSM ZJ581]|uniref:MalY/PatB family protein n=1 Tax=Paraliobacillus sp. JSM ZJ581 TaxID=3342118 RepID=UPI0035A927CE
MVYNFDQEINRIGTYCTQWDFISDRFGTMDVIPFSISDMDFQSPQEILHAIQAHTKHGVFGYTRWNHEDFKSAISKWYKKRFNTHIKNEWIVYSPSVIYTISKLIEILTEEDDYIVVQTPGYDAFFKQIPYANRSVMENPLLYIDGEYELDLLDLKNKLSHSKAKVLLLCNPHNPTGRVWRESELAEVVKLCEQYEVKIISDDIHMDMTLRTPYNPIINVATNLDHIFICSSASKTFNTPSLGGSYALIPNPIVKEKFNTIMKNRDGVSSAAIFGMLAVMVGYNSGDTWVDALRSYIHKNMKLVKSFIDSELPAIKFTIPESTYLAWIDCSNLNVTNAELQAALINKGGVGIMSGEVYREKKGCFIRMNVGCSEKKVLKGLEGIKKAVRCIEEKQ